MISAEYGHLFAGEKVGTDQLASIAELTRMGKRPAQRVVLVDDYSVDERWSALEIAAAYGRAGACPDLIFSMADMAGASFRVADKLSAETVVRLSRWACGSSKVPTPLLIATWNAARLGIIESPVDRLHGVGPARTGALVSILPDSCEWVEMEAAKILEELLGKEPPIKHRYFQREDPWSAFNPEAYAQENYALPQAVDMDLAQLLRDAWRRIGVVPRALEVGTGANLYPALSALDYVDELHLTDRNEANLDWIREQQKQLDPAWLRFDSTDMDLEESQVRLSEAIVRPLSLYKLTDDGERWPVIQMFFVVDSISTDIEELRLALQELHDALEPGGTLLAVFTLGSRGYCVSRSAFPATNLQDDALLDELARAGFTHIELDAAKGESFREGYDAIVFVEAVRG